MSIFKTKNRTNLFMRFVLFVIYYVILCPDNFRDSKPFLFNNS